MRLRDSCESTPKPSVKKRSGLLLRWLTPGRYFNASPPSLLDRIVSLPGVESLRTGFLMFNAGRPANHEPVFPAGIAVSNLRNGR